LKIDIYFFWGPLIDWIRFIRIDNRLLEIAGIVTNVKISLVQIRNKIFEVFFH
jgi:hypothetical protein